MAKKKITKKAEKATIENKAIKPEAKKIEYKGYISMGGAIIRMSEAKARLLLKQGKAKFA